MRGEVNMGKIIGICISEKRGVQKHLITEANIVCDWGIEGDAHGGKSVFFPKKKWMPLKPKVQISIPVLLVKT